MTHAEVGHQGEAAEEFGEPKPRCGGAAHAPCNSTGDLRTATFYRALWRRLTRGEPWSGRFSNRRADGGLYEVEATITPIRGSEGEVVGYIGVQRDVTELLAARSSLAAAFRERAALTAALARLQPRDSAESEDQVASLIALGSDTGQGYLLGRPGPASAMEDRLRSAGPVADSLPRSA